MQPTAFLHEGVRNFAMACRYARTDEARLGVTERRYEYYLDLASKLLANYHIAEASYYYYWINEVKPLDKDHDSQWEIAKKVYGNKIKPNDLLKLCNKSKENLLPSCGIYALLKNDVKVAEKVFKKISTSNPTFFGKEVFLAYWEINNDEDDDPQLKRFKEYISQLHVKTDVLSRLNYASAHTRILRFEGLQIKINSAIQELGRKLEEAIRSKKLKWISNIFDQSSSSGKVSFFLQFPPDKEASKYISLIAKMIEEGQSFFSLKKNQDEIVRIGKGAWGDYFSQMSDKQNIKWTPTKNKFASYSYQDLPEGNLYKKEIQKCKSDLGIYLSKIQRIDEGFKYYLEGLKEKLSYVYLKEELRFWEKISILISDIDFQQEIQKLNVLSKKKIFISYSSKDRKEMLELKNELEGLGIQVTVDDKGIRPQDKIVDKTDDFVRENDFTISLVSPNSLLSPWVGQESIAAFKKEWVKKEKSTFIPIVISEEVRDPQLHIKIREELDKRISKVEKEKSARGTSDKSDLNEQQHLLEELHRDLGKIFHRINNTLTIDYSTQNNMHESISKLIDLIVEKENVKNSQESAP